MMGQPKFFTKKSLAIAVLLTLVALGFRLFIALRLPTDEPDDGRLYARIANNVLDHGVYSIATEEPYSPTYIRLPGYPLFLAAVYKLFGRDNNKAARVIQAFVDTLTCWFIAWLALAWTSAAWALEKRRRALLIALALAATCPFLAIYTATILTEIWTAFFAALCALAASLGLRSPSAKKQIMWWIVAGLAGGGATSLRPDSGLFVAAVGCTLVLIGLYRAFERWRAAKKSSASDETVSAPQVVRPVIAKMILHGLMLTLGFAMALAPWTVRNARVFGVFMPIAPMQANMPDEFVPEGFMLWLKTWVNDVKYTETVEWAMDDRAIHIEQIPAEAFDSPDERDRIAALLVRYNKENPVPPAPSAKPEIEDETAAAPPANDAQAQPNGSVAPSVNANANSNTTNAQGVANQPASPPNSAKSPAANTQAANRNTTAANPANKNATNKNAASADSSNGDDASDDSASDDDSQGDDSADDDSSGDDDQPEEAEPPKFEGEMTPDIDADFGVIARERIARHPFHYYVTMRLRRAASLWFDTHAQYYPFQGELLPLKDLDHDIHQDIWLPLFAVLTWLYTLLAVLGAWVMWRGGDSRRWLLLFALLVLPRLAFLSTIENPEPRYVVGMFTFVMAAAGLAVTGPLWDGVAKLFRKRPSDPTENKE